MLMQERTMVRPIVLVTACALVVLSPGLFSSQALGHAISDMPDHLQGSWWFGGEVLAGRFPFESRLTHLPNGGIIWYADPIGALFALLFRGFGYPFAWNIALAIQVLLAGWAATWLGWKHTQSESGALTSGIVGVASPYTISLLHSGVSEALGLVGPFLFTGALIRLHTTRTGVLSTAGLLFLCTLQAPYYGMFGLLMAGCLVVGTDWKQRLLATVRVFGVWLIPTLPLVAFIQYTLTTSTALVTPDITPGWIQHGLPATDFLSWLHPGAWYHPDTPMLGNPGILHVNYLGYVLLLLVALGATARSRNSPSVLGTGLYGLFCLGPAASFNRQPLHVGSWPLLLPLALLYLPGSPFRAVHHPYRMVAFLLPLLALMAAEGTARLPRFVRWLAPALLFGECLFISPAPWPIATTPILPTEVLDLAPGQGAILDFPPDRTDANRSYALAQVRHGRPIAYGLSQFLSEPLRQDPMVAEALRALEDPVRRARNRDVPFYGPVLLAAEGDSTHLSEYGFDTVLLHERFLSVSEKEALEVIFEKWLGPPTASQDGVVAWTF